MNEKLIIVKYKRLVCKKDMRLIERKRQMSMNGFAKMQVSKLNTLKGL